MADLPTIYSEMTYKIAEPCLANTKDAVLLVGKAAEQCVARIKWLEEKNAKLEKQLEHQKQELKKQLEKKPEPEPIVEQPKCSPVEAVEPIETAIQGEWAPVEYENVDEYLSRRCGTPMKDMLFRYAHHHFYFHDDMLTMFQTMGGKMHFKMKTRLETHHAADDELLRISYVLDNALYTTDVLYRGGIDMGREKRFVKDGRLHIIRKRHGVSCTRIYNKVLSPTKDWEHVANNSARIDQNSASFVQNEIQLVHTPLFIPDQHYFPNQDEYRSAEQSMYEQQTMPVNQPEFQNIQHQQQQPQQQPPY